MYKIATRCIRVKEFPSCTKMGVRSMKRLESGGSNRQGKLPREASLTFILKDEKVLSAWVIGKGILGSGTTVGKICQWNCKGLHKAGHVREPAGEKNQNISKSISLLVSFQTQMFFFKIPLVEKSQINNLILHLMQLEKEAQTKPKVSRGKEIIKIRAEINEIETKKTIANINKTKRWFLEKINKID